MNQSELLKHFWAWKSLVFYSQIEGPKIKEIIVPWGMSSCKQWLLKGVWEKNLLCRCKTTSGRIAVFKGS